MAHDEMTDVEKDILSDPFLEETTDVNFLMRSEAFQDAYRRKFRIAKPEPHPFDVALDARIENDVSPSVQLRAAVTKILRSDEGRRELSERDPKWRSAYLDNILEQVALEFRRRTPDYLKSDHNLEVLSWWLQKHYLNRDDLDFDDASRALFEIDKFTPETLQEAYRACLAEGLLQVPKGQIKPLSKQDELSVIAEAQMSGPAEAIVKYIELAMGELPNGASAADVSNFRANNPRVCNQGTLFVFRNTHGYALSEGEWSDFAETVSARSPLLTFQMLVDAYAEFRRATKSSALFPNGRVAAAQETTNPDDMTNEELAAAILAQRRAAVRQRQVVR